MPKKYLVDIESLHRNFPERFPAPPLLLKFADWVSGKAWGSLGSFDLQSNRVNDMWIENGADLHPSFACFMRDPSGGQVGYWLFDGPATASPPIVFLGSEGELQVLCHTLADFLSRLAKGNTQVEDFDSRDDGRVENAELVAWLKKHESRRAKKARKQHPDLTKWMKDWSKRQCKRIDQDPLHLKIAESLRKYVKPKAEPWELANFDVLLVGTQFKMWHRSFGPKAMPQKEVSKLEAVFRAVREQRARQVPERGLWFYAWVNVGASGGARLSCDFLNKPRVQDQRIRIPASDYHRDLREFPRSAHWMPQWLQ